LEKKVLFLNIKRIDHIVLPVADLNQASRFYHEVFDMPILTETETSHTLRCGHQLIVLQKATATKELSAANPTVGGADLCIVAGDKMTDIVNHLKSYFVNIVAGPVETTGSEGKMTSVFLRDYDNNLIEVASYKG